MLAGMRSVVGLSARTKIQPCCWRLKVQSAAGPPKSAEAWSELAGHGLVGGPLGSMLGVGTLSTVMPLGTSVATQPGRLSLRAAMVACCWAEKVAVAVAGNSAPSTE